MLRWPVVEEVVETDYCGILSSEIAYHIGVGSFPGRSSHRTGKGLFSVIFEKECVEFGCAF